MTPHKSAPLQEVKAFLQSASAPAPSPTNQAAVPAAMAAPIPKEGIELELPSSAEAAAPSKTEDAGGIRPNPVLSEPADVPTRANTLTATFNRGMVVEPPTAEERTLFQSALWHGEPVVWDIALCGGSMEVRVRSLPTYQIEDIILAWAADKLPNPESTTTERAKISLTEYYTLLQRAYTFLRVERCTMRTARGNEVKSFDLKAVDAKLLGAPSMKEATALLDGWIKERMSSGMNHMLFSLLVEAMAVHEHKLCMCLRSASNPNFWQPGTPS